MFQTVIRFYINVILFITKEEEEELFFVRTIKRLKKERKKLKIKT